MNCLFQYITVHYSTFPTTGKEYKAHTVLAMFFLLLVVVGFWLVDWVEHVDWSNMWLDCGGWVGQYPSLGIKYAPPSQRSSTRFQLSLIMPSLAEPF